jgi:hypothetical protein
MMKKRNYYTPDANLLTATEVAKEVFRGSVSREWVRQRCKFARVELSPRKVFYRVRQIKARYGR